MSFGGAGEEGKRQQLKKRERERERETPRRKTVRPDSEVKRATFCNSTPQCSYHTQRTIFSSFLNQLLRLQNVPLKHKTPSGKNDFQSIQRSRRLREHRSGVGCPNLSFHYITHFSRVGLDGAVGLGCPRALSLVQQIYTQRRIWFVCFCFEVSGFN